MDPSLPLSFSGPAGDTTTLSTRCFGVHEMLIISSSYLRPAGANEWNVLETTLPCGLSLSTYPSLPVQPTSSLQDLCGGRSMTITYIQPDPPSNPVTAAHGRERLPSANSTEGLAIQLSFTIQTMTSASSNPIEPLMALWLERGRN